MSAVSESRNTAGTQEYRFGEVRCEDCGERASLFAAGWQVSGPSESYSDELPALAFRCPDCAAQAPNAT